MSNAEKKYPYFGVPPIRRPRQALNVPALRGKRVILSTPEGFVYDMRAVSERHLDDQGSEVVKVLSEEDYYRWMLTESHPHPESWAARLVWVE